MSGKDSDGTKPEATERATVGAGGGRAWLVAQTGDLDEKQRWLEASLELEPDSKWAKAAPKGVRHRQLSVN